MRLYQRILPLVFLLLCSSSALAGPLILGQTDASSNWTTVTLDSSLLNPVIFTSLPTNTVNSDAIAQVRNVTGSSFEVRMLDASNGSSPTPSQTLSFLAVESGTHQFGSTRLTAGTTLASTSHGTPGSVTGVAFSNPFGALPGILTSTQTVNDPNDAFMVSRTQNESALGFDLRLQTTGAHQSAASLRQETVGWLAFETGAFNIGAAQSVGLHTSPYIDEEVRNVSLAPLGSVAAVFGQVGYVGGDLAWLSTTGTTGNSVNVFVDESVHTGPMHANENVSLLAFDSVSVSEPGSIWLLLAGLLSLTRLPNRKSLKIA